MKRIVTIKFDFDEDASDQAILDAFARTFPTVLFGIRGQYKVVSIQRVEPEDTVRNKAVN